MTDPTTDELRNDLTLQDQLRGRCCPLGTDDHGHTDCWLFGLAADRIAEQAAEIDRLRRLYGEAMRHLGINVEAFTDE